MRGIPDLTYEVKLRRLNSVLLGRRRLRGNMVIIHNILKGGVSIPVPSYSSAGLLDIHMDRTKRLVEQSFR